MSSLGLFSGCSKMEKKTVRTFFHQIRNLFLKPMFHVRCLRGQRGPSGCFLEANHPGCARSELRNETSRTDSCWSSDDLGKSGGRGGKARSSSSSPYPPRPSDHLIDLYFAQQALPPKYLCFSSLPLSARGHVLVSSQR